MGERSAIGWTEATWNPWYGCTKVSEGCDHCYMFRDMKRYGRDPEKVTRSKTKFGDPLKWKEPKLIFTCSWSDWFHKDADAWRDEAWQIVKDTPHHTYQILTKRPGRIVRHLPKDWGDGYANVWLGTSVESQEYVTRAHVLADIPARVRFLSCEPMLGPIELDSLLKVCKYWRAGDSLPHAPWHPPYPLHHYKPQALVGAGWQRPIHWIIAGGESGAEQRACETDWLRSLRDQCAAGGVAFFLKQLGGHPDARAHDKALLDGITHTAMPSRSPSPGENGTSRKGGRNG